MQCYNGYRSRDHWHDEKELEQIKARYSHSAFSVLEWMPHRKEFNALGFSDAMIKDAIIKHFGKYNDRKDKKKNFDQVFLHWFTTTSQYTHGHKPNGMSEQISGIYSEGQSRITYSGCKEIKEYVKVENLVDWRIQQNHHVHGSFLLDLLKQKFPSIKKFERHNAKQKGLGSFYCLGIEKIYDAHIDFRTVYGDINGLKFGDIATSNIKNLTANNIEQEIKEYIEYRKPQIEMNDADLKKWLDARGFIYVYDGNGHEEKNLVKKYIPSVKQERAEWKKNIERISKRQQDKKFIAFLEMLSTGARL